jgi:hypothetical protein
MSAEWKTAGAVELYIDARPEDIYDRIADVTGTGDRSLECSKCVWLPGAPAGTVGSRFRGTNRKGRVIRWSSAGSCPTTRTCALTWPTPSKHCATSSNRPLVRPLPEPTGNRQIADAGRCELSARWARRRLGR